MRRLVILLFVMVLVFGVSAGWAQTSGQDLPEAAKQTTAKLLGMLDAGQYKETADLAASAVADVGPLWQGHMKSWRDPMGEAKSRSLAQIETITSFADLPKGEYLKATYNTEFSTQPKATEIVVLAQEADGAWKIAGYEVQYNRWPEAIKMIINSLLIVFFIMILLAFITWAIGKVLQKTAKKAEAK